MHEHLLISVVLILGSCGGRLPESSSPTSNPKPNSVTRYVAHLDANGAPPTEYVLGLFRSHDVVILGERLHPELTQWELIYEIVTDPRFVDQVGTLYTEYGPVNLQDRIDRYLADPQASREQLHAIVRDFGNWPTGWGNANFIEFLDRLRRFNTSHSADRRVRLRFADCFWDWRTLDEQNFPAFWRQTLFARDFLMAKNIEAGLVDQPTGRKKALVIMNTRHSYVIDQGGRLDDNTGSYLRKLLRDRSVVSVLLNTTARFADANDHEWNPTLVADGKWDAAFRAAGDRPIGFDLAGSPFGDDRFDLHDRYRSLRYRDVYHGVVFVDPLARQTKQELARGYFTADFIAEVRRRMRFATIGRTADEIDANRRRLDRVLEIISLPSSNDAIEAELYGPRPVYREAQLQQFEQQIARWR